MGPLSLASSQNHWMEQKKAPFFLFLSYSRSSISSSWCSITCLCTLRMKQPFHADSARDIGIVNIQEKGKRKCSINASFIFYSWEYKQEISSSLDNPTILQWFFNVEKPHIWLSFPFPSEIYYLSLQILPINAQDLGVLLPLPVLPLCVLTWITLPLIVLTLHLFCPNTILSSPPEAFSHAINQAANNLACFKVNNCIELIYGKHNRAGCGIRWPLSHRTISLCPWPSASTNKQVMGSPGLVELNSKSVVRMVCHDAFRALLKVNGRCVTREEEYTGTDLYSLRTCRQSKWSVLNVKTKPGKC